MTNDSQQSGMTAAGIRWHINGDGIRIYSNECGGCGCRYYTTNELRALHAACDMHMSYGQSND